MEENNEELYKNLVILLKMFKNRPYHLAKYLVENSSLSQDFIKKLLNSNKLKEISDKEVDSSSITPVYFVDIQQMEDFYISFIDDIKQLSSGKNIDEITKEINQKLDVYIKSEKFEDAARIRDYMTRNGIKRTNF
jgi:hypothetical protein